MKRNGLKESSLLVFVMRTTYVITFCQNKNVFHCGCFNLMHQSIMFACLYVINACNFYIWDEDVMRRQTNEAVKMVLIFVLLN